MSATIIESAYDTFFKEAEKENIVSMTVLLTVYTASIFIKNRYKKVYIAMPHNKYWLNGYMLLEILYRPEKTRNNANGIKISTARNLNRFGLPPPPPLFLDPFIVPPVFS
jgi:hypothetical protein